MRLALALFGLAAGIPATAQAQTEPVPIQPQRWITNADYPAEALRTLQRGVVWFRLDVDAQGKVVRCTITQSSNSPLLDKTTCGAMRRSARFQPATDASGAKVAGSWSSRFSWSIPGA